MELAPLTSAERRRLKGVAQHLEPVVFLGKAGPTPDFLASVAAALASRELIKVRFTAHQDERRELAATIATQTASHLVTVIGHVAVFYRLKPPADSPPTGSL